MGIFHPEQRFETLDADSIDGDDNVDVVVVVTENGVLPKMFYHY
jgi:hypothetical protein